MKKYKLVFDKLKEIDIMQYRSYMSASQYITSYSLVEKFCPKEGKVLDWGAGEGHFSYFLLEQGMETTAYNVGNEKQELLKIMESGYSDRFSSVKGSDAVNLPFEDNYFDAVCSIGVLEHVRETSGNEPESLAEIRRVLKPGGVFICTHLPNRFSWIEAITKNMKNKHNHPYKYSKKEAGRMIKEAGFSVLKSGRHGFFPRLMFGRIKAGVFITGIFNGLDALLSVIFNLFTQNLYFVAEKK